MTHLSTVEATFRPEAALRPVTVSRARQIHQMLTPFPVAYFAAAFVTDLAYWRTDEVMWERFSVWLIAGGLVIAALVAIAAVIDLAFGRQKPAWFRARSAIWSQSCSRSSMSSFTAVMAIPPWCRPA